eukprot:CAMPEP_0197024392 /NCGR_PEP_ID=MMETSP1384-20130603/4937_1 /TAXON_ID=29189 /ORGANISM="Ammonia sp." /LENGTH=483 /DNA_ID=CAMNT_0042452767 /DNA_START=112 /DNA_END=1563 /DNA_ORIENTATION=-
MALMLIYCLFIVLTLCIDRPLYLLRHTLFIENQFVIYANYLVLLLVQIPIGWLLLLKYWLIYFLVNWIKITLNKTWQTHLNPRAVQQNWFLRKRSTFGNLWWTLKRLCIFLFLIVCPVTVFPVLVLGHSGFAFITIWSTAVSVLCPLTIFYLFFKIRRFDDDFYIVFELKVVTSSLVLVMVLYIFLGMLPAFGVDEYFRYVLVALLSVLGFAVAVYVQTWYIVQVMTHPDNAKLFNLVEHSFHSNPAAEPDGVIRANSSSQLPALLRGVLSSETQFESFIRHTAKEWSMENLLSFIELTQLQQMIKNTLFADRDDDEVKLSSTQQALMENASVPESYIVHHASVSELMAENSVSLQSVNVADVDVESKMVEFKLKSYLLYKKYIVSESQLQINISYEQRGALHALMRDADVFIAKANLNELEVYKIYGDVVRELKNLLNQTYHRYTLAQEVEYSMSSPTTTTVNRQQSRPESPRSMSRSGTPQ